MKKYLKKASIFMVLLVSVMCIVSCGNKTNTDDKDFAVSDFTDKLGSDLENLKEGTEDDLKRIYDISKDDVEDFKLYVSPDGNLHDQLLVVKAKSEEDLEGLKNKIEAAKDKAVEDLGDAGEDVKGRIENSKVYTKGRYLVYSISDDGENIKNSFEEMFNK
ncbi:Hypothetical protein CM240_2579 [Clostridium bornimense]|uniref:DUF4358 domain-containing protein n=1 Tax=Clostridium bornimense TaxID=1216932 RepID=W6RZ03_9CLOT|nr:DUF4358 domain-containing protein [Clostridium bornimense]CDM69703.1 Hypothetical protein CM240_2579 [Clostridium bornimense]